MLMNDYDFKLKGTGRVTYHLGCDFFRDAHGVLCMAPRAYLERMNATFTQMFGEKRPTRIRSPLEPNDHPELDDSGLLDEEGIRQQFIRFQLIVHFIFTELMHLLQMDKEQQNQVNLETL